MIAAVDAAAVRPMVVGHSAACGLAWLAADARPGKVSKIALIGGFPSSDGAMAFPCWSALEGPDSADLGDAAKQAIASAAIPSPKGSLAG